MVAEKSLQSTYNITETPKLLISWCIITSFCTPAKLGESETSSSINYFNQSNNLYLQMNISNIYKIVRFSTFAINNSNINARSDPWK